MHLLYLTVFNTVEYVSRMFRVIISNVINPRPAFFALYDTGQLTVIKRIAIFKSVLDIMTIEILFQFFSRGKNCVKDLHTVWDSE